MEHDVVMPILVILIGIPFTLFMIFLLYCFCVFMGFDQDAGKPDIGGM